jgi:hypothetical protein
MKLQLLCSGAFAVCLTSPAFADDRAMGHAPIGVMADHRHKKGEVMLSYRYMRMDMDGSRTGTDGVDPDTIATTVPNRFFGMVGQPPTLRVVPVEMTMDMHMVGVMYGLTDRVTLMGMGSFVTKDMDHITYMGGAGTTQLGGFTTEAEGFGDTTIMAIIGLDDGANPDRQFNFNIGVSLPTGSTDETGQVLTPANTTPTLRLPYPMQLGSGTFDLKPALTYRERSGSWGWGAQASGVIRLDDNDEGYALGDRIEGTAWLAYEPAPWISLSGRIEAVSQGRIDGIDPMIVAPVQTADPDRQGGETVEALFGVNLVGREGWLEGHRLAAEIGLPLYRDLNGPQLETDFTFTLGWQKVL